MQVAILGGGIAGLSAAIALKQLGLDITVYERRASLHNLGAGIVCWPNASFVLSEFGILNEVQSVGGEVSAMRRVAKNGLALGELDINLLNSKMGYPSLSILRADLMQILFSRAEQLNIPVNFNACAVGIEEENNICQVQFADGLSIQPDLILGADGRMNSIVRSYVTGGNSPVFQGFLNWIGIFESESNIFKDMAVLDYWGVGSRFGIVPVTEKKAYWAGGIAVPKDSETHETDYQFELEQTFIDWPDPIGKIIARVTNSNTRKITLYDHEPTSHWHKNNVLMIGDAAHAALPTSGQGAAQALEDAWWMAREFKANSGNLEAFMKSFTKTRFPKTAGITYGARGFAKSLFNTNPQACVERDSKALSTDYVAMATGMATGWSAGLLSDR